MQLKKDAYEERMRQTASKPMPNTDSLEARLKAIDAEYSVLPRQKLLADRLMVLAEMMRLRNE
jgi:hypothetical protein